MKIHIDLDCFFVSAERINDPSLRGKPVGIGGRGDTHIFSHEKSQQFLNLKNSGAFVPAFFFKHQSSGENDLKHFIEADGRVRGMLTTTSYEARAFGIKTGATIREALQLCPDIIIKKPNMQLYQELSYQLKEFLKARIPVLEQGSIDEFYGDLSGWIADEEVESFIKKLKEEVYEALKLPISIGAAPSKYTAKMATNDAKPYGCLLIKSHEVDAFIRDKPIEDFPGIGKRTAKRLHLLGLKTLGDIQAHPQHFIHATRSQRDLYERVCGIDNAPLIQEVPRKSIGISRTFDPLYERDELRRRVIILSRHLAQAIMKMHVFPTHYTLSIRYEMQQKSHLNFSSNRYFSESMLKETMLSLLQEGDTHKRLHVIRLGLSCGGFTSSTHRTFSLLSFQKDKQLHRLTQSSAHLRNKYGLDTLQWGSEL